MSAPFVTLTAGKPPLDDLIELLSEIDAAIYDAGQRGAVRMEKYRTAQTFNEVGISGEVEGFVEGEAVLPAGIRLLNGRVRVRFENPGKVRSPGEWASVEFSARELDEFVSGDLYQDCCQIVAMAGLGIGTFVGLADEIEARLMRKPALQDVAQQKIRRAQDIRAGIRSEAEQKAVEAFYDNEDYGAF